MKTKRLVPAVTALGVALLAVLGGAGCASSSNHASITHENECLTAAVVGAPRENLGQYPTWRFPRGSVVSPLGDAPSESDWGLTSETLAQPYAPCADGAVSVAQTGLPR
jgi:hypothetical protein